MGLSTSGGPAIRSITKPLDALSVRSPILNSSPLSGAHTARSAIPIKVEAMIRNTPILRCDILICAVPLSEEMSGDRSQKSEGPALCSTAKLFDVLFDRREASQS